MHIKANDCSFDNKTYSINLSETLPGESPPKWSKLNPEDPLTFGTKGVFLYIEKEFAGGAADRLKLTKDNVVKYLQDIHGLVDVEVASYFFYKTKRDPDGVITCWELHPTQQSKSSVAGTKLIIWDI